MTTDWLKELRSTEDGRRILEQERLIVEVTEAIAMLLEETDVSRSELARRIGKSPAFVTKLLRGDNNFTLRTLSDVFFALGNSAHMSVGELGEGVKVACPLSTKRLVISSEGWCKRDQWRHDGPALTPTRQDGDGIAA
jgi:Helix-turn-helix